MKNDYGRSRIFRFYNTTGACLASDIHIMEYLILRVYRHFTINRCYPLSIKINIYGSGPYVIISDQNRKYFCDNSFVNNRVDCIFKK